MKKRRRLPTAGASKLLMAGLLVTVMSVISAIPAMAAPAYTPVAGGQMQLKKYLVMETDAHVPEYTPQLEVSAGKAEGATEDMPVIYAGINPEKVMVMAPAFHAADTAYTEVRPGEDMMPGTEKYIQKEITLDFGQVSFPQPGVYRYILTEEASEGTGITNDAEAARTLDVYVTDDHGALKVSAYVLHSDDGTGLLAEEGKSDSFINRYTTHNLTFTKKVEGKYASRDQWFKVTFKITNAVPGTSYDVDLTAAAKGSDDDAATKAEYQNQKNPETITAGSDGTVTADFYVRNGHTITIKGLAEGTAYTLTEDKEDYLPSVQSTGDDDVKANASKDGITDTETGITADTTITFTNTKNNPPETPKELDTPETPKEPDTPKTPGSPESKKIQEILPNISKNAPTGDTSNVGVWILLLVLALFGLIMICCYRKRKGKGGKRSEET